MNLITLHQIKVRQIRVMIRNRIKRIPAMRRKMTPRNRMMGNFIISMHVEIFLTKFFIIISAIKKLKTRKHLVVMKKVSLEYKKIPYLGCVRCINICIYLKQQIGILLLFHFYYLFFDIETKFEKKNRNFSKLSLKRNILAEQKSDGELYTGLADLHQTSDLQDINGENLQLITMIENLNV